MIIVREVYQKIYKTNNHLAIMRVVYKQTEHLVCERRGGELKSHSHPALAVAELGLILLPLAPPNTTDTNFLLGRKEAPEATQTVAKSV